MGRAVKDLVGLQVGKLTVIAIDPAAPRGASKGVQWLCLCSCGNTKSLASSNLVRGTPQSCGCARVWGVPSKFPTPEAARKANSVRAYAWNKANPEAYKRAAKAWYENHKGTSFAGSYEYSKRRRSQRCLCCSDEEINEFYKLRPSGFHVDHIYPLSRGGLHCRKNMQHLPAVENFKKGARLTAPHSKQECVS